MPPPRAAPTFSVIIPTRDRAAVFECALLSVLAQDLDDFEVIVVNDGSCEREAQAYGAILQAHAKKVHGHHLVHRPRGHGPAYARNFGATQARGRYLCFLDDDDVWTDASHLRRCRDTLAARDEPVDLYFTDQDAVFSDGRPHPGRLWLSGVEQHLATAADALGNYRASLGGLLRATGFAHLNCSIYRRAFFDTLGGLDEAMRYEEDRDLYLRAIDAAGLTLYNPAVIARHHIPDARKADNASTIASQIDKQLCQLRLCDKLITTSRQPAMRNFGRRTKGYTLKQIAETLKGSGRSGEALFYMREALSIAFTVKWFAYTALSTIQAVLAPRNA